MEEPGATCSATLAPPADDGHGADGLEEARAVAVLSDLGGALVTRELVENTYDAVCKALVLVERAGMACADSPLSSLGPAPAANEPGSAASLTPTEPEPTPGRTLLEVDSSPERGHAPEPDHAPEPTPSKVMSPEVDKPCRGRNAKAKASSSKAKAKRAAKPRSSPKRKAAPKSMPKSRATRRAATPKAATKAKAKALGKRRAKKTKRSAEDAEMGPEATEAVDSSVATSAEMGAGLAAEVGETVDSNMGVPARAGMAENTETPEASEHRYANGMTEKEVAKKMHSASRRTLAKVS